MRTGFTTGSCAAAAAKAAAYMLLFGQEKSTITIQTPKGIPYQASIEDIRRSEREVSCAVRKDGGDDPDVTTGLLIYATVTMRSDAPESGKEAATRGNVHNKTYGARIVISGGTGVGHITKPGLDQPVGEAAINHVPREMIMSEVTEICREADYTGSLLICISVPEGEEIAKKTFNPRLGIEGGISIIGTSGIVEPMSSQALLDTIRVELNQRRAMGYEYVAVSPGNYGLDYMKKTYHYDLDRSVKCSNYIGDTIDMARELGFRDLLLTGHVGKLIKVSGGIMNTHSREGDCRMELLAAAGVKVGVSLDILRKVLDCVVTEEALRLIREEDLPSVMQYAMERIQYYLQKRAGDSLHIECIMYSNEFGELARSEGAEDMLRRLQEE